MKLNKIGIQTDILKLNKKAISKDINIELKRCFNRIKYLYCWNCCPNDY